MDLAWKYRPPEEAAYFNPAFCGELLSRATKDYFKVRAAPIPFALCFLILPLVLHPVSRRLLPHKATTTFETWCADNEQLLVTLPERVLALRPVTREALLFMAQVGALDVRQEGVSLGGNPIQYPTKPKHSTTEVEEIRRRAGLLGRWFASQPAVPPILQAMGVRL